MPRRLAGASHEEGKHMYQGEAGTQTPGMGMTQFLPGPMPGGAPFGFGSGPNEFSAKTKDEIIKQQEETINQLHQQLDDQWEHINLLNQNGRIQAGQAFDAVTSSQFQAGRAMRLQRQLSFAEYRTKELQKMVERERSYLNDFRDSIEDDIEQFQASAFDLIEDASETAARIANQQDGRWPPVKESLVRLIYAAEQSAEHHADGRMHSDGANDFIVHVLQNYNEDGERYDRGGDTSGLNADDAESVEDVQSVEQDAVSEEATPVSDDPDPEVSVISD